MTTERTRTEELTHDGPTLYLPGGGGWDGFLFLPLTQRVTVAVKLTPSKVRLLVALAEAMRADAGLSRAARGWRRPERLARIVADQTGWGYMVEAQTVRAYLAQIKRAVRKEVRAARRGAKVPQLLEHRRGLGVRLATDRLMIVEGTNP